MNRRPRRNHSSAFKAKVALDALKEQKTLAQLAGQYSLHQNQICDWKKVAHERLHELFDKSGTADASDIGALRRL